MYKVVIVDDELETLMIHKTFLEGDFIVEAFQYADAALRYIETERCDVVLVDMEMPFINGLEFLDSVRRNKKIEKTIVIGVTGKKEKGYALNFLAKRGNGYLIKPVTKEKLITTINGCIETAHQEDSLKSILLVDDEIESLVKYKSAIVNKYKVITLNSGKMALEYLTKYKPDLIILDYQMPLYSGISIFTMIRKNHDFDDVPVMFLTGTTENEVLIDCATLKPSAVVLKSIPVEDFAKKVDDVLERSTIK